MRGCTRARRREGALMLNAAGAGPGYLIHATVRLERLTLPGLCALACRVAREPWLLVR